MTDDDTGNAEKLPLAERARRGLLLAEPALLLSELLELEHQGDLAGRYALSRAIQAAIDYGDLAAVYVPFENHPGAMLVFINSGDWRIDRESYRHWRAQCPARLLSDLSRIQKWLGATPVPDSLPVESAALPVKLRPDQLDRLDCQAIARALWAEHPDWPQAEVLAHPRIAPYRKQWPGKNTVPGWLSEVDPRPKDQRRGRPARR